MKLVNLKNLCIALCALVFSSALFADVDSSQMIAQSARSRSNSNMSTRNPNTWKPYYMKTSVAEPMMSAFYQQNVGLGLLYASGVRGNLNPAQYQAPSPPGVLRARNRTIQGKTSYNRTPVYEFVVGRDVWNWLKIALSYQHQGGVTVTTQPQMITVTDPATAALSPVVLMMDNAFDSVQAKAYFLSPWTLVWKNVYHEPYLGVGVGPGWITANNIYATGNMYPFKQKITTNCTYTIDFGFKLRKALPSYIMSFVVGCKYNQWGRIGSIGDQHDQPAKAIDNGDITITTGATRDSLMSPFSVGVIYGFVPYVGVQFNF